MTVPVVRVEGPPLLRGRLVGEALTEPIHRSLGFYRSFLDRRGLGPSDLPRVLGPYREAAESAFPWLMAELDGMAAGSGADWWDLFAVNALEELEPMLEGGSEARPQRCTAFAVTGPEGTILAHNEQWYAGDRGNVAVVVAVPDTGPPFASPTVVSCLPSVGLNASGVGQAIMSLSARDDRAGVPRVLVSRHALGAADARDAVARADAPGRAGGYAHLFALAGGAAFTVETTAAAFRVLEDARAHTNHYLSPELASEAAEPSPGSASRLARLLSLLAERPPTTPQEAMNVLGDHQGEPQAICLHPHEGHGDEAEAVVFSLVCHLEESTLWVAPGNPCETDFTRIDLSEVVGVEVC